MNAVQELEVIRGLAVFERLLVAARAGDAEMVRALCADAAAKVPAQAAGIAAGAETLLKALPLTAYAAAEMRLRLLEMVRPLEPTPAVGQRIDAIFLASGFTVAALDQALAGAAADDPDRTLRLVPPRAD